MRLPNLLEPLDGTKLRQEMDSLAQTQENARRFNEDSAVQYRYEQKRALREFYRANFPLSEKALDWLDWQTAERECRTVRAIGTFYPSK